ncbi:lepidopteran low molecular weight (30 kD) lipoprotein domain-containing protein [Phthorimaea operculella]|nr:lepidopteran low molecular weight (30 kD) lipoprotein domain-containing protein [Phthorimaea operculella]
MHSISLWNFAQSPNYDVNVDMIYPYSEVPYIGNYKLVKIPISFNNVIVPTSELLDHVDYWGEGRINATEGSSGFPNCYNVNHQYQLVSNGPDTDRKIPNRIPVISYTNCDTSSYIRDKSVKLVTLMGAPINTSCAKDIARMVHPDLGQVVVYGFKGDATDIKNLEEELAKKQLYFCYGYKLPELLKTISLFSKEDYRAYLNITDLGTELYRNVSEGTYDNAINVAKMLEDTQNSVSIVDVVTRLLKEGKRNTMTFACKLWHSDSQNMVTNYFPISFKLIFNQDTVKIMSKKDLITLKLDLNVDTNSERLCIGDTADKESPKVRWKLEAVMDNEVLYFKIFSIENEMFLKLEDVEGEKICKGSSDATDAKSQWILDPIKIDDDLVFYIINREFDQGLKLTEVVDQNVNKRVLGHNGSVYGNPDKYGWYISPW